MSDNNSVESFCVDRVRLERVEVDGDTIRLTYQADDLLNVVEVEYAPGLLSTAALGETDRKERLFSFAVFLGVVGIGKFAPVLPRVADLSKFASHIHPSWIAFLKSFTPGAWSEHRYQLLKMDYQHPEFIVPPQLGADARDLIWARRSEDASHRVMVASGSGKDSLLCSLLLQNARVPHDLVTYLFDLYGNPGEQKRLFSKLTDALSPETRHAIVMRDNFYPWLEGRMLEFGIKEWSADKGAQKPFRTEAGEVFFGSLALVPIQVVHNIELQLFGNEKSADAPNLICAETGEAVAHQWEKSLEGERTVKRIMDEVFPGFGRVSLTKCIHDVKIFETLFRLDDQLPYSTNSCNIQKPWCCACEKCLYVFAGFCAFGDHAATVNAFGDDLFDRPELLPIWKELLGLKGHIAWECVGHPEELQLYLYKCHQKGVKGPAIDLFVNRVLLPSSEGPSPSDHFSAIEKKYSAVCECHHSMPFWLWTKIQPVLEPGGKQSR